LQQLILVGEINNFKTKDLLLKNVEKRFTADVSPDRNGTATRVSKPSEERAVVLRYTGAGTVYSGIQMFHNAKIPMLLKNKI